MAKRPQWFDKKPIHICHPAATLRDAAKVLRHDAKLRRKAGLRGDAELAVWYAEALERIANGKTWAEGFEFPAEATP